MYKNIASRLRTLIIATLCFGVCAIPGGLYAQEDESESQSLSNESNLSITPYEELGPNDILYKFDEYTTNSLWYNIQYPYANFYCNNTYVRVVSRVNETTYYPNYIICDYPYGFGQIVANFPQPIHNLLFYVIAGDGYGTFKIDLYKNNQYAQTLTFPTTCTNYVACPVDLRSHTNISGIIIHSINDDLGVGFDNFSFTLGGTPTPTPTPANKAPIGYFDRVRDDGVADGWTLDPDNQNASNTVHIYIDGQHVGTTTANLSRPDVNQQGYQGNHGFEYNIPPQFRDGNQHSLVAYGLDLTNGQPATTLIGSPKTFTLGPVVESTVFVPLTSNQLSINNNAGGGLRIYPESETPGAPVNNKINVKAKISSPRAGVPVYFKAYDLDDPSTDDLPIDSNGNGGRDNRSDAQMGDLCPFGSLGCEYDPSTDAVRAMTDSNGEAIVPFFLTTAHPGDNYAIIATTKAGEPNQIVVDRINLRNSVNNRILQENTDRTPMLTAWRKLHIEVDSMGIVQYNYASTRIDDEIVVGYHPVTIPLTNYLDSGRFQNGRMEVDGNFLYIDSNDTYSITVRSLYGDVIVFPTTGRERYRLYDDDDFNNDNSYNGFDADNGEDVEALGDSFNLMQENDDKDCSDQYCNAFAAAYITPERNLLRQYNTSNIPFVQNNSSTDSNLVVQQIEQGRNSNSAENDNFWVVYVQIAYQPNVDRDCDANEEQCTAGITPTTITVNSVLNESEVPIGGPGSLIFIETMRDGDDSTNKFRIKDIPHEIGHQFGIDGDASLRGVNFGLMGYSGGLEFIDRHLNVIRWRKKSPGVPRN
jgi:hypothetical protein